MAKVNFTTPVGRIVGGNLYKGQDKDADGNPLLVKNGANKGLPRLDYYFELAVPKAGEQHWNQTAWGLEIWQVGATEFPQVHMTPTFAWKVTDGDSQVPNTKGKRPCDRLGFPGHWVLRLSSGFPPKIYRFKQGTRDLEQVLEQDFLRPGFFAQVNLDVGGNGSQQRPGVYLNHAMVCFIGYGEEIISGPDPSEAGFGGALPPGASATPISGAFAPAAPGLPPMPPGAPAPAPRPPAPAAPPATVNPTLQPVPGAAHSIDQLRALGWTDDQIVAGGYATRIQAAPAPLPPGISAPAPVAPVAPIAPVAPVVPNPAFAQIPPAPVGPQLTPAGVAAGGTLEAFRAQGWDDAALRGAGYLA